METLPVTLIVKAPNQQIEDQTVHCELSWTIQKLKQHLSEVYPSKPPKHEQKLIYSGKLLNDTIVLKDILRQYDGQDTHTVHLVCTPKYTPQSKLEVPRPEAATPEPPPATPPPAEAANEGTNQRVPDMQWFNQNQYNPQNMDQYAMNMFMMQQAYMQYITQYMNMATQAQGRAAPTIAPQPVQPAAAQPIPREEIPPNAPIPQPAAGNRELEPANRDWLDVFYTLSRIMIFVSIVYFYSSPVRCLFVVVLGMGLYLYQIGFFRNVNINNNNIVQGETAEAQAPTRLMVLWTFFTTFFASLIPEIPNVV